MAAAARQRVGVKRNGDRLDRAELMRPRCRTFGERVRVRRSVASFGVVVALAVSPSWFWCCRVPAAAAEQVAARHSPARLPGTVIVTENVGVKGPLTSMSITFISPPEVH